MSYLTSFALLLCGVSLSVLLFCGWMLRCNSLTLDQRMRIIEGIGRANAWSELERDFDRVPYNDHMWKLAKLQDWRDLYSAQMRRTLPEAFE